MTESWIKKEVYYYYSIEARKKNRTPDIDQKNQEVGKKGVGMRKMQKRRKSPE